MPITIPDDKLIDRKEVAKLLQLSYSAIAERTNDTECLMEIRFKQKVLFNPYQVLAHRAAVWEFGKCEGRCLAALQKAKVMPMKLPLAG